MSNLNNALRQFIADSESPEYALQVIRLAGQSQVLLPDDILKKIEKISRLIEAEDFDDAYLNYLDRINYWFDIGRLIDEFEVKYDLLGSYRQIFDIVAPITKRLGTITARGYEEERLFNEVLPFYYEQEHDDNLDAWRSLNIKKAKYGFLPSAAPFRMLREINRNLDPEAQFGVFNLDYEAHPNDFFVYGKASVSVLYKDEWPYFPGSQENIRMVTEYMENFAAMALDLGWATLIQQPHKEGKLEYPTGFMIPYSYLGLSNDIYPPKTNEQLLADHWALDSENPESLTNEGARRGGYPHKIILAKKEKHYVTWRQFYQYDNNAHNYSDSGHYDMTREEGYTDYVMRLLGLRIQIGWASRDRNSYKLIF